MTDEDTDGATPEVLFESNPSVRPTVAVIAAVVLVAAVVVGLLLMRGDALGGSSETLVGVVAAIAVLLVLRYLGRIYILLNTDYVVTRTEIRREFSLFLIQSSREVPIHQLRGIRFSQNVFQRLFGHGSVSFLTAGPNQSLGFLSFENMPDAASRRDRIRGVLRERYGEGVLSADETNRERSRSATAEL